MRSQLITIIGIPVLLAGLAAGQARQPAGPWPDTRADAANQNGDVTYGRVKEFTPGKKLVIAVDNAPDKSYDMTDKNTVVMIRSAKVGDWVRVTEKDVSNGKKHVSIAKSTEAAAHTASAAKDKDITYGRIREYKAGNKVVIDVDNAPDKSYNLSDKNNKMESSLKVGDPVKITERKENGVDHYDISADSNPNVRHGDNDPNYKATGADRMAPGVVNRADRAARPDVTEGTIKELTAGRKVVINVPNAPDKSYDLSKNDTVVTLGKGLKVGDPVSVREHEMNGKKHVEINRHTS